LGTTRKIAVGVDVPAHPAVYRSQRRDTACAPCATPGGIMGSEAGTTTTMTLPAARGVDLTKVYGSGDAAVHALAGLSVELAGEAFTAIMGPSGSGKSTLMHCLAGLDRPTSGSVYIGEVDVTGLGDKALTKLRRDQVGFVFQSFNLLPQLSAAENITLPLRLAGRAPDEGWHDMIIETMGLGDRLTHRPAELSGGQQQRVAAARALVSQPDIVFADEPTGNLDSRSGTELLDLLRRSVSEFGQTIVMVTHDAYAAAYADRVVFLADGVVEDDLDDPTADEILERMKTLAAGA
jgi:putative ABC transport system ATP-binding protein